MTPLKASALVKILLPCAAFLVASVSVFAQSTTPGGSAAPGSNEKTVAKEEAVKLPIFEVTTTEGHGYVSNNSVSGFKTNEPLLNIPQVDIIVTRDLITDVGSANSSDILANFGVYTRFGGSETVALRGVVTNAEYIDEMPANPAFADTILADSYDIIKGPAQVLYMNATLTGTVLKSTKQPLPYNKNVVTVSVDSWGLLRSTLDSTGPLGTLGGAKISYRFVAAAQNDASYFRNMKDERRILFPEIQVQFKDTTIRAYYSYEEFNRLVGGLDLVTPDGSIWTGAGRNVAMLVPESYIHLESSRFFAEAKTHFSENWANQIKVSQWHLLRDNFGSEALPLSVNWGAKTVTYQARRDNIPYAHWSIQDDIQGNYELGPFKNIDAFGFGWDEYTVTQKILSANNIGFVNPTVSMYDAAAIDAIVLPTRKQYDDGFAQGKYPSRGNRSQTTFGSIYWQHTIDIVPNYLTLVMGASYATVNLASTPNISQIPWQTTTEPFHKFLHRYGAVFKPIKEISLYALESTTMTPPSAGSILANFQLPPPLEGKGQEAGIKASFFGGRLSMDFAVFKMSLTNVLQNVNVLPNGYFVAIPIGSAVERGFDGDISLSLIPGWQVIGNFYSGHDRDQNGIPVPTTYDNSWGLITRYDFQRGNPLHGLTIGTGVSRIGGRWISNAGITNAGADFTPYQIATGRIKLKTGTAWNAFAAYNLDKHWTLRLNCNNILNKAYVSAAQTALLADPSAPRTFVFETDYKF